MTGKQISVLLIEAEPDQAELVIRELEHGGFRVLSLRVEHASAMREALEDSSWDAVISEHALPGFSGLQALQVLREKGIDTPFLMISDTLGEEAALAAMRAGANDYLLKQDLSRLVPSLRKGIAETSARQERVRAEAELRDRLDFAQMLLDTLPTPIFYNDPDGLFLGCNKAFEQQVGIPRGEIINKSIHQTLPGGLAALYTKGEEALASGKGTQTFEGTISRADGEDREVICYRASFSKGLGSAGGTVGALLDISERKRREMELRYLSTHDMLTGMYNRDYFDEELERLKKGRRFPVSIVVADLDLLKQTNDRLGHAAGDELLKGVAALFRSAFRREDVAARVGGDEFAALLPGTDETALSEALQRIREHLSLGRKGDGRDFLSLSIGAATAHSGEELMAAWHAADQRMYCEKKAHHAGQAASPAHPTGGPRDLPPGTVYPFP